MSPNAARYDEPHYVYWHYDDQGALIYVGMTCEPETRPYDKRRRAFLKHSFECVVSPAMTHEAASVVERESIRAGRPKYNQRITGQWVDEAQDPRIPIYMAWQGCTKTAARQMLRYYPQDLTAFQAAIDTADRHSRGEWTAEELEHERQLSNLFGPLGDEPTERAS